MAKKKTRKKSATGYVDSKFLKQHCNLRPDTPDQRDHQFAIFGISFAGPSLPKVVDYSRETGPVGDQGPTGSCVGWASVYGIRRWLHLKETGRKFRFSVRFGWMGAKEYDPFDLNVPFDGAGTRIRDALRVMRKFGACPDSLWPFSKPLPDPNKESEIKSKALKYRIGNYHRLGTNDARRVHLAKQGPFAIGVPVFSNWSTISSNGIVPEPGGYQRGGHAILVVGYDDKRQMFKFQNSWSRDWGDKGCGYLSYDWVEKYSWDSWGVERL